MTYASATKESPGKIRNAHRIEHTGIIQLAFIVYLWVITVGILPLEGRISGDSASFTYLIAPINMMVFLIILYQGIGKGIRHVTDFAPPSLQIMMFWFALTIFWSESVNDSVLRFGMAFVSTSIVFMTFRALGTKRAMNIVVLFLICILTLDVITSLTVPSARHLAGERDSDLVGLWRGLHSHKNIAGSVAAFGLIVGLFYLPKKERRRYYLIAVSTMMLFGAFSKTSLAMIVIVVAVVEFFVHLRAKVSPLFSVCTVILSLLAIVALSMSNVEYFENLLGDESNLTGRVHLWNILLDYWSRHPWGSGYGGFWGTGYASPVYTYARSITDPALFVPHGHNGYLDVLAATSIVGLGLAVMTTNILPIIRSVYASGIPVNISSTSLACVSFYSLHNMLESSIFMGQRVPWTIFCVGLACLTNVKSSQMSSRSEVL